ncbi:hypothetical protein HUJ05_011524 [Dendroctonus ponderosae]|nr:hypothetical protein HUJ05_011524 [Dendroctonus ponderosae]
MSVEGGCQKFPCQNVTDNFPKNRPENVFPILGAEEKMNRNNAISQSSLLQEMVRIKKIRFKDEQRRKLAPKNNLDAWQRKANFEEFKTVYEESMQRLDTSLERKSQQVHQTRSGSLCRFPRSKKEAQYVETINIELPIHYGADRAVQIIENKIKPKRASRPPKVNREVITENLKSSLRSTQSSSSPIKKKKSVTIADKLGTIEETAQTSNDGENSNPNPSKVRKEKIHKTISRHANVVKPIRKKTNSKIMDALCDINEKLHQMQEKYFNVPKVQYKNVNDCFTQIGNVEILYENLEYPEKTSGDVAGKFELKNISQNVLSDSKMQERIREMNEMFPEFPKIEDTLKEIETHLDNIVNLEADHSTKCPSYTIQESVTNEILKMCDEVNDQKRRTMRYQIDEVEDFCEKLSEIANESKPGSAHVQKSSDFLAVPDLQASIEKSSYLSRELRDIQDVPRPMVKIFSENKLSFWREKMKQLKKESGEYNAESAARLFDSLKFSLEDSVYEPVA